MNMNDGGHMHGTGPTTNTTATTTTQHRRHMMMHMTFFWGKNAEILFDGWPGYDHLGMYLLALAVVFLLALAVEWLSHCSVLRGTTPSTAAGLLRVGLHAARVGVAYLVMLAVMSFNAGVFLVAVAGHSVGFFLFGRRRAAESGGKEADLPPMSC